MPDLILVSPTLNGGAGRACARLADSLSSVQGKELRVDLETAIGPIHTRVGPLKEVIIRLLNLLGKVFTPPGVAFTIALVPTGLGEVLNSRPNRLVHIHSLSSRLLSLRELQKLRGPVLWTLHDTWAIDGLFHYSRQTSTLPNEPRSNPIVLTLAKFFIRIIRSELEKAIHPGIVFVAPSRWVKNEFLESQFGAQNEIVLIPNPLDTEFWIALDRNEALRSLGLDTRKRYLLFASSSDQRDPRKGAQHLRRVLDLLLPEREAREGQIMLLVAGPRPEALTDCRFPITYLGALDDSLMRQAYSAADVVLVPSEIDNLPQVATEAQSCGRPVVAFNVGGISDTIVDGSTGFLVDAYNCEAMVDRVLQLLREVDLGALSVRARRRAKALWGLEKIGAKYRELYLRLTNETESG